ncbi:MAG: iron chelate uptake ABC transporter family permease subunit, partial [Selenomonadaceae bacterium]|nr:iron chelate uptake ABC transporter family permease subunit [Selenomonadaceae bacterium]
GGVLQGIMKNPLADPHIIGISSGAGLCGIFVLLSYPEAINFVTPIAFIGAMGAAVLIYILAYKGGIRPVRMILAGVAVSAFLGAGISAMLIFYSDRAQSALLFMVGGLSARSWPHVEIILPYAALGIFFAILGARTLNILQLGDESAKSLGVSVEKSRLFLTATAALLAASAVSVAGLLGFIGLIVPHAARLLIGSDFKKLIPASALLGAATLTIADTVARVAFSPTELPVGILTAILGAPFFLYLLRREV